MNVADFQKTLTIISKYIDAEKEWFGADHDIIYLPLLPNADISEEDAAALEELGAFKSDEFDCWAVFT